MVILGWILDKPLPLLFDPFESMVRFYDLIDGIIFMMYAKVLYISGKSIVWVCDGVSLTVVVNVMTYVVGDGKSNWLEGAILICLFFCLWFLNGH